MSLGNDRTLMALDRTLMAWTRTSLSLISFGFTIYKFLQVAEQTSPKPHHLSGPKNWGIALVAMGVIFLALACLQFWSDAKRFQAPGLFKALRLPLLLAILLTLLGLLALSNLIFQFGPF